MFQVVLVEHAELARRARLVVSVRAADGRCGNERALDTCIEPRDSAPSRDA